VGDGQGPIGPASRYRVVLGLLGGVADLTRYDGREVPAHSRVTPKIRGFDPLRFDRPFGGEVVELGGIWRARRASSCASRCRMRGAMR